MANLYIKLNFSFFTLLVPEGPSYVCEVLQYTWQYFAILPGARGILQDFLGIKNSKPKYNTEFKVTDRKMDTTGFDRYYQNTFSGLTVHKPEEFKKGSTKDPTQHQQGFQRRFCTS